jgi:hypothetical protein
MKFLGRTVAASLLLLCLLQASLSAQDAAEKNTYAGIATWFTQLLQSVDQIAAYVDKRRLISYTTKLGNSFESMIVDKRDIAEQLKRSQPDREELRRMEQRLKLTIELAKTDLASVSLQFKELDAQKGHELADDLNRVFFERKGWLAQLGGASDQLRRLDLARQAEESANALSTANTALAAFLKAMKTKQ